MFKLKAAWGPREETVEACGQRLAIFVELLSEADPSLAVWHQLGRSKPLAEDLVVVTPEALSARLESHGRNRTDVGGVAIPSLGFSAEMWNGRSPGVSLALRVGATSTQLAVPNSVNLELPTVVGSPQLYSAHSTSAMFRALVVAWEPDWASLHTFEMIKAQRDRPGAPIVGWKTYLSAGRTVGRLPARVFREALRTGNLLTVGAVPDDATIPAVLELRGMLDESEAMGQLR